MPGDLVIAECRVAGRGSGDRADVVVEACASGIGRGDAEVLVGIAAAHHVVVGDPVQAAGQPDSICAVCRIGGSRSGDAIVDEDAGDCAFAVDAVGAEVGGICAGDQVVFDQVELGVTGYR